MTWRLKRCASRALAIKQDPAHAHASRLRDSLSLAPGPIERARLPRFRPCSHSSRMACRRGMLANATHMISLSRTQTHKKPQLHFHGRSMAPAKVGAPRGDDEVTGRSPRNPRAESEGSRLQRRAHAFFMHPAMGHDRRASGQIACCNTVVSGTLWWIAQ
jgi:hypothetical protein